jgi:tetratricopeptide (TPR) repeat protein
MLSPVFQAYTDVALFLIGIALFLLVIYLREAIANTFVAVGQQFSGESPLNYERGNLQKNIQRSARRLERKGDFQGAGEAYESLELWRDAAAVYERGNLYGRAATSWQMAGNTGKAIEYNEKDGNYEAAGQLCLAEGLQDRAAKNFRIAADQHLEANQFGSAAEFYEKAHDYDKAALIFEQAHKPDRALNCYEKSNNVEKVLDIIRLIPVADYHRRGPDFTRLVQRCAEQLTNNGFATEGAKILEETQDLIRAAEIYGSCKMWEKSAELYLKS